MAQLSARDWADAALDAIRSGGLAAVAVEPLATRLGASKGSFYWHFPNRAALIDAALARWEELQTEAVIAALERHSDPEDRIRALFRATTSPEDRDPLELALLADAAHPQVAATMRRVTTRRLDYLTGLFAEYGLVGAAARNRALLAYIAYLGNAQLVHAVPDVVPRDAGYLDDVLQTLLRREED